MTVPTVGDAYLERETILAKYMFLSDLGMAEQTALGDELLRMRATGRRMDPGDLELAIQTRVCGDATDAARELGVLNGVIDEARALLSAKSVDDTTLELLAALSAQLYRHPGGDPETAWRAASLAGLLYDRVPSRGLLDQAHGQAQASIAGLQGAGEADSSELASAYGAAASVAVRLSQTSTDGRWLDEAVAAARQAVDLTSDTDEDRAQYLASFGYALALRYEREGRRDDLEEGLRSSRQAVLLTSQGSPDIAGRLARVVHALALRYRHEGDVSALEEAVDLARKAVELTPDQRPDLAGHLNNLANQLFTLFEAVGGGARLDEAIDLARRALDATSETSPDFPTLLNGLAGHLSVRFRLLGRRDDLEDALRLSARAVQLTPGDSGDLPGWLSNHAAHRASRFNAGGELTDLEGALELGRRALALLPAQSPDRPMFLGNQAALYASRFDASGDLADLDEAIATANEAVDLSATDSPNLAPRLLNNLGGHLARRSVACDHADPSNIDDAVRIARRAVELTTEQSPDHARFLSNLAAHLYIRFQAREDRRDLDEAVSLARRAVDLVPESSIEHATCLSNLARYLFSRFASGRAQGDRKDMRELLDRWIEACAQGRAGRHEVTVAGPGWLKRIAGWADRGLHDLWEVAARIGLAVLEGAERLSATLPATVDDERRRRHAFEIRNALDGVGPLSAYAHLRASSDAVGAVMMLERALTTIAVQQAGGTRWEHAREGAPELVERLLRIAQDLALSMDQGKGPGSLWAAYDSALHDLETQVGPLAPRRSFDELASTARGAGVPLVWFAATPYGGFMLVLRPEGHCFHVLMQLLTTATVASWHGHLHPPTPAERGTPGETACPSRSEVDAVLNELGAALHTISTWWGLPVWLVPVGLLATLPWQAKWPDIRVQMSGALHAIAAGAATRQLPTSIAAFVDPDGSLAGARIEGAHLRESFRAKLYEANEANLGNLATVAGPGVLHIAAHGTKEPAILLADGDLRPEHLPNYPNAFGSLRLLFINTCLSGSLPDTHLEEAAGFATAAAVCGTASTLTALWPVSDRTAAAFSLAFYSSFAESRDPHAALCNARSTTPDQDPADTSVLAYQLYGH